MNRLTKSERVLLHIVNNPGTTQTGVIHAFPYEFFEPTPEYGSQQKVSRIISKLRERGLLRDVSERCRSCNGALTRGKKNVKLYATQKGVRYLDALGIATRAS